MDSTDLFFLVALIVFVVAGAYYMGRISVHRDQVKRDEEELAKSLQRLRKLDENRDR